MPELQPVSVDTDRIRTSCWVGGPEDGTRLLFVHGNLVSGRWFADVDPKPPVLWVWGSKDPVVSDASALDFAVLGQAGVVPGWPGDEAFPAQPQVSQTRALLERYAAHGGSYREVCLEGVGHGAVVERPDEVARLLTEVLAARETGA
jgi:pimeloyl-ACP methyl ester carboxylesterase